MQDTDSKKAKEKTDSKNSNNKTGQSKGRTQKKEEEGIKIGGVLNLIADMTHNFTDGLALASSFLLSTPVGKNISFHVSSFSF